MNLMEWQG